MAASPVRKRQVIYVSDNNLEDRISQLPDGALADILSLLTLTEAGRSSVLSKRWRDLWKSTTRLNFDAERALHTIKHTSSKMILDTERSNYVTWVNDVLRTHENSTIDEFKVQFNLDASASDSIDEWIKFLIPKKAKRVEIDLTLYAGDASYTLSQECYHHFKSVANLSNIMNLRSLSLGKVNVDGGLLEYLLSNCHHLEMLSISWSRHLLNLKVAGPSLVIKYLEIRYCSSLESIRLSAPKLEKFIYLGHVINLSLGSIPMLSELSIGGGSVRENVVSSSLSLFERNFSHLESLTLSMKLEDDSYEPQVFELRNLRYLKLVIHTFCLQRISCLTCFIAAAPSLAKFSLELNLERSSWIVERNPFPGMSILGVPPSTQPHHCLKEVEIFGYPGSLGGFDLAWYLIKTSINLEKMVIDPCFRNRYESRADIDNRKPQLQYDKGALTQILRPGAELIFKNLY